jgi:K+-transporting ATPase ATPase C chain
MKALTAELRPALLVFALLTLLTGLAYPLVVTGIAQVALPAQANGSLVTSADGALVGSALIGQNFTGPAYFWGRPSATAGAPYTPFDAAALTGSGGSNLGPRSSDLRAAVEARIAALQASDPGNAALIPVDLVTASGSGLDPHISAAAARYQAARVARARGLEEAAVAALIERHTEARWLGIFGELRVNVLALNRELDATR